MGNDSWAENEISRRERSGDAGWSVGPKTGRKIEVIPKPKPSSAARRGAQDVNSEILRDKYRFQGKVNSTPFRERSVRSKRWYLRWSLRAKHLLRNKNNIKLEFPSTSLAEALPVLEILSNLPFRVHQAFEGRRWVSTRKYDQKAKELLYAPDLDVWGSTGAMQVLLAYWRAFKRMKKETGSPVVSADTELVLSIKPRRRLWGRKLRRKSRPAPSKPVRIIDNSDLDAYDPYGGMQPGEIRIERSSGKNGRSNP